MAKSSNRMYRKKSVILVTGGAGFIGSHFVKYIIKKTKNYLINLDKLTYSGDKKNIDEVFNDNRHKFIKGDISNKKLIKFILKKYNPSYIINFAAETHVDNSIKNSNPFIKTNIVGTFNLLECSKSYWDNLNKNKKKKFKFLQISTDEVYGQLKKNEKKFDEKNKYDPSSPYSASKASADHLVRAFFKTYDFPINITNCSNNYGPNQHKEKLIPLTISKIIKNKKIPVYGNGQQIRDWLFVEDHVEAIWKVAKKGKLGETYLIGGNNEMKNISIVKLITNLMDLYYPSKKKNYSYENLISFVKDRPGHDFRYAINSKKIQSEINWKPKYKFKDGLKKTILWFLNDFKKKK